MAKTTLIIQIYPLKNYNKQIKCLFTKIRFNKKPFCASHEHAQ